MNQDEINSKREALIEHLGKVGIPREEVENYFNKEKHASFEMGMNDEDSYKRALISTVNYYRKVLDKMGNRITFLCLGVTQPTDYGLSKVVKAIKNKWKSYDTSDFEKSNMIEKGIVNQNGTPLHTTETTFVENKIGQPIILEDEFSQTLMGVVNNDGKIFPALVKVYGKKECEIPKIMYTWCSISADQSQFSKPEYILLNSRELGMKKIDGKGDRIKIDEFKSIVESEFSKIIYDVSNQNDMDRLDALITASGNKVGHIFLKNVRMSNYSTFPGLDATTELTSVDASLDLKAAPIIADMKIPSCVPLDVDPATMEEVWLLVMPREKNPQYKRQRFDALGMYVNTPIKKDNFNIGDEFTQKDEKDDIIKYSQPIAVNSNENAAFYGELFPNR